MKVSVPINLSEVQTGTTLMEPGVYHVRITEADASPDATKSKSEKPCMVCDYEVLDEGPYCGISRRDWVYITEASAWRLKGLLDAARVPYEVNGGATIFDNDDLVGKEIMVVIEQIEKRDGSGMVNEIKAHLSA